MSLELVTLVCNYKNRVLRWKPALSLLSLKCNNSVLLLWHNWQDQNIKALIIFLHCKDLGYVRAPNENGICLPTAIPWYHYIAGC